MADGPARMPAVFSGLTLEEMREAYASLAEVGPPGISMASAVVAGAPAASVEELLDVAGTIDVPVVGILDAEPLLAGVVEHVDLDHRSLLDDPADPLDFECDLAEPLDTAVEVIADTIDLDAEASFDPSGEDELLAVADDFTIDQTEQSDVDEAFVVADEDDDDPDDADDIF
jgi:hypothetical protein